MPETNIILKGFIAIIPCHNHIMITMMKSSEGSGTTILCSTNSKVIRVIVAEKSRSDFA